MINTPVGYSRLVAFFPHDDFLRPIHAYRSRLLASGYTGAFSFPACIPLGSAKEALTRDQLISLAAYMRHHAESTSGYFNLSSPGPAKRLKELDFFYTPMQLNPIQLNPTLHQVPSEISFDPFGSSDFILCLTDPSDPPDQGEPDLEDLDFPLRFRTGFVANLVVWPADQGETGLSFCWERGNPAWLPSPPRRKSPK
jgi:hypothetical protein